VDQPIGTLIHTRTQNTWGADPPSEGAYTTDQEKKKFFADYFGFVLFLKNGLNLFKENLEMYF
jgi:hypothetical protein